MTTASACLSDAVRAASRASSIVLVNALPACGPASPSAPFPRWSPSPATEVLPHDDRDVRDPRRLLIQVHHTRSQELPRLLGPRHVRVAGSHDLRLREVERT